MPPKTAAAGGVRLELAVGPAEGTLPFVVSVRSAAPEGAVVAAALAAAWSAGPDSLVAAMEERGGQTVGGRAGFQYCDPRAENPIPEGSVRLFDGGGERLLSENDFETLVVALAHFHLAAAAGLHVSGPAEEALRVWLGRRG